MKDSCKAHRPDDDTSEVAIVDKKRQVLAVTCPECLDEWRDKFSREMGGYRGVFSLLYGK